MIFDRKMIYGVDNQTYRLLKEMNYVKFNIKLLENNKIKYTNLYRDPKVKITSDKARLYNDILSRILKSLEKKNIKLNELMLEYKELTKKDFEEDHLYW